VKAIYIFILISVAFTALVIGIQIGFFIGFSRVMRAAATRLQPRRPVIAWFIIGSAVICLLIAIVSFFYSWTFSRSVVRAEGKVIQLRERQDSEHGTMYSPVVLFRDSSGADHTINSSGYSTVPHHRIGESVVVLYRPDEPSSAKLNEFMEVWGLPTIAGFLAGFYLPVGFMVLYWPKIWQRFQRVASPG
jgi:hypothetical protein